MAKRYTESLVKWLFFDVLASNNILSVWCIQEIGDNKICLSHSCVVGPSVYYFGGNVAILTSLHEP